MTHKLLCMAMLLATLASAWADEPPILRYSSWMLVPPTTVRVESRPYGMLHDDYTYRDQPSFSVIGLDGDTLATIDGKLGASTTVSVPDAGPLALLHLQPGNNYAVPQPASEVYWYIATPEAPLNVVRGFDALYFWLPPGLSAATIFCHAFSVGEAGKLIVSDLGGNEIVSLESDFNEPEALLFQAPAMGEDGALLRLSLVKPANPEWTIDDAKVWLGPEIPGLLAPTPEGAEEARKIAPLLGIETDWTPLLDFEGADNPIGTIQWSKLVEEGAALPAYEVSLSDEQHFGGEQSLRVAMRFPEDYAEPWQQLKLFTKPLAADDIGKVRLFMFGDGSGRALRIRVRDASQEQHYFDAGKLDWVGWKAIVADLEGAASAISGGDENKRIDGPTVNVVVEIAHSRGRPLESVVYVDDIAIAPAHRTESGEAQ